MMYFILLLVYLYGQLILTASRLETIFLNPSRMNQFNNSNRTTIDIHVSDDMGHLILDPMPPDDIRDTIREGYYCVESIKYSARTYVCRQSSYPSFRISENGYNGIDYVVHFPKYMNKNVLDYLKDPANFRVYQGKKRIYYDPKYDPNYPKTTNPGNPGNNSGNPVGILNGIRKLLQTREI